MWGWDVALSITIFSFSVYIYFFSLCVIIYYYWIILIKHHSLAEIKLTALYKQLDKNTFTNISANITLSIVFYHKHNLKYSIIP